MPVCRKCMERAQPQLHLKDAQSLPLNKQCDRCQKKYRELATVVDVDNLQYIRQELLNRVRGAEFDNGAIKIEQGKHSMRMYLFNDDEDTVLAGFDLDMYAKMIRVNGKNAAEIIDKLEKEIEKRREKLMQRKVMDDL